jgi:hypothetical protein
MEKHTLKVKDFPKTDISAGSRADCSKRTCGKASTIGQERYLFGLEQERKHNGNQLREAATRP